MVTHFSRLDHHTSSTITYAITTMHCSKVFEKQKRLAIRLHHTCQHLLRWRRWLKVCFQHATPPRLHSHLQVPADSMPEHDMGFCDWISAATRQSFDCQTKSDHTLDEQIRCQNKTCAGNSITKVAQQGTLQNGGWMLGPAQLGSQL